MLVLDGNMKNRRDVCMAHNVGCTIYEGLPGVLKTGCMNSPEFKARHCSLHRVRACTPYVALDFDEAAPERKESREKGCGNDTGEKVTRKATYYKVNLLLSSNQMFIISTIPKIMATIPKNYQKLCLQNIAGSVGWYGGCLCKLGTPEMFVCRYY